MLWLRPSTVVVRSAMSESICHGASDRLHVSSTPRIVPIKVTNNAAHYDLTGSPGAMIRIQAEKPCSSE